MANLTILGAAYGPADVSGKVRSLAKNETLTVAASNSVFGDPWPGTQKSLMIVFQYDNTAPQVKFARENDTIQIAPTTAPPWHPAAPGQLTILGATYGLADVTAKVTQRVDNFALTVPAENSVFGDTWVGVVKTLSVVYQYNGIPLIHTVKEHETLVVGQPLQILGATYGPTDVTAVVAAAVTPQQELHITANNTTFGDTWPGTKKSLTVTYRYGQAQPQSTVVQEGAALAITYAPTPGPLQILGAAYGAGDVTAKTRSLVSNNALVTMAENSVFGDTWPGVVKTYTVTYQYGNGPAAVRCCQEHSQMVISEG